MTYTQQIRDGYHALDLTQQIWLSVGYGVVDPDAGDCSVSVGSGSLDAADTVNVAAGTVLSDGTELTVTATDIRINSVTDGVRKDLIWVDATGAVQKTEGDPRTLTDAEQEAGLTRFQTYSPAVPFPAETPAVVLGVIAVNDTDTDVAAGQIQDRRQATPGWMTADAADFSGESGTDGQVLTSDGADAAWQTPSGGTLAFSVGDITLADTENYVLGRVTAPTGADLRVQSAGVNDGSFTPPIGLEIEVYNETDAVTTHSTTETTYEEPNAVSAVGGDNLTIRLVNGTGGTVDAAGFLKGGFE